MGLESDKRFVEYRVRSRSMEAFLSPEEVFQQSFFGQFEKVEKSALSQPDREIKVCVSTEDSEICSKMSTEDLKRKYMELRGLSDDLKIPVDQRVQIARQARDVLDELMKSSPNYEAYRRWCERVEQEKTGYKAPISLEGPDVFKKGVSASEAKKYRRF